MSVSEPTVSRQSASDPGAKSFWTTRITKNDEAHISYTLTVAAGSIHRRACRIGVTGPWRQDPKQQLK